MQIKIDYKSALKKIVTRIKETGLIFLAGIIFGFILGIILF